MNAFLSAHGHDPGPTQRPVLAGAITGLAGTVPAIPLLGAFGSLAAEARILALSVAATIASGALVMALAGALYGRLFQRAANDRRGGWLFGMAYGFLLWAAGAVMVLPIVSGGAAPGGLPALGILLALLAWGTALGAAFPIVHRLIHVRQDGAPGAAARIVGPLAAVHRGRPGGPPARRPQV